MSLFSSAVSGGATFPMDEVRAAQDALSRSSRALESAQKPDGHWVFELEADATIPAEYILLDHFLGRHDRSLHQKMAVYLRSIQEEHGGWPLFPRGALDVSATVKAYFALKCVGDRPDAPHMIRARQALLAHGGAEKSNVFTRIQMALFGAVPWKAVPVMPVEIVLLPKWFPFHLSKVAYWSRTVIVPLLVLCALKPRARNPKNVSIDELFVTPPAEVARWNSNTAHSVLVVLFDLVDRVLRFLDPWMPKGLRKKAIETCVAWIHERLNGQDGLGGIYPAMANAVMMYDALGYAQNHPDYAIASQALEKLVVETDDKAYCQPCLSPVWDTALAAHAMLEAGNEDAARKGCEWLLPRQILDVVGDYAVCRPEARPGGWAFQYANPYYPDLDDTAVVVMAMDRLDRARYKDAISRATEWVLGLQSKNGGWGAFDADNTHFYLNYIPFADHGALLDPPSADVTARCLAMLAQLGHENAHPALAAALSYLRREQEPEGCWFGRWGTNYIYGTWSVLCALNAVGIDSRDGMVRRAVSWLISKQRQDGGWGESGASYWKDRPKGEGLASTPAQTAWALLGLMAAGEVENPSVARGIGYLIATQKRDGTWDEPFYTAVGFPRVFYLRYHGYRAFFPAWALARYHKLKRAGAVRVMSGM